MNVVHMNGLALLPGIDYTVSKKHLMFSTAPPPAADITFTEVIDDKTGAVHITHLTGNGSTYLFELETDYSERVRLSQLFEQALKYKDISAVRDLLDQLQVVIELVKQDVTIR